MQGGDGGFLDDRCFVARLAQPLPEGAKVAGVLEAQTGTPAPGSCADHQDPAVLRRERFGFGRAGVGARHRAGPGANVAQRLRRRHGVFGEPDPDDGDSGVRFR
ncbi:hypothetical protein BJG92_01619 [Arthrobacter sp. SO5]|nr:hypothetical protein [Arthrobacter sp. SO5]